MKFVEIKVFHNVVKGTTWDNENQIDFTPGTKVNDRTRQRDETIPKTVHFRVRQDGNFKFSDIVSNSLRYREALESWGPFDSKISGATIKMVALVTNMN